MTRRQQFVGHLHQHQRLIHSLCRSYFANNEDREDAFQEIVLQLWKSYPSFRGDSSISTWMYRVALRTIFNLLKQRRLTFATLPEQLADDNAKDTELIRAALSQLNPSERALLILYLEGYSYQEISQIQEMTLTNVSTRLNRIRQKLRSRFQSEMI
uniref:Sigma-70 family RNA polymerase sigma factor n=1 Tax=Roseihalotalea indica TaxID=2867963 RepID=A0AA49PZV0_9BACT|nr:sigma-70 family RNA polymerase sigma factor [Tunicatimonas sp. TK19036]